MKSWTVRKDRHGGASADLRRVRAAIGGKNVNMFGVEMRTKAIWLAVAIASAAAGIAMAQEPPPTQPVPFVVNRGSAPPPPAPSGSAQTAPAEGIAAGGIDFGQWRSANPETYGPAFETQMRRRFAGQEAAAARADLEANGFTCGGSPTLQCRIEIMENSCAKDWYVVFERNRPEPVAGFDVMCLGAR